MSDQSQAMVRVSATIVLRTISERMIASVLDAGFVFVNEEDPPLVRMCECFPSDDASNASDYIAQKAEECNTVCDSDGNLKIVAVCTAIGSAHVGLVYGLKVGNDQKPRSLGAAGETTDTLPSVVMSSISHAEMAAIMEKETESLVEEEDKSSA